MRLTILFFAGGLAFAQSDTNTLTITASRNVSAVPDQVVFDVSLNTGLSATLDEVVRQLADTGIMAASLTSVFSFGDSVDWSFELVTQFSKMKDAVAGLSRLKSKLGPGLAFSVATQRTSSDAQSQACPLTSLVSDARREAERIASAAGVRLGGIVGLSDRSDIAVPTAVSRIGDFSSLATIYDPFTGIPNLYSGYDLSRFLLVPAPAPPSDCSMVVQFRLLL